MVRSGFTDARLKPQASGLAWPVLVDGESATCHASGRKRITARLTVRSKPFAMSLNHCQSVLA